MKNEEKNKKGKKWINVVIIVFVLLFGFVGGIFYTLFAVLDQYQSNDYFRELLSKDFYVIDEEETFYDVDDDIKKIYQYIPDLNSNYVRLNAYQNKKITLSDLDNSYLLAYAVSNLELSNMDKKPFDDMELGSDWYIYDATLLQNKVQEMYGKNLTNESYIIEFGEKCEYVNNNYQCGLGGSSSEFMSSIRYITNVYADSENLYIEDKYMVEIIKDDVDALYEDSTKTKLIVTLDEDSLENFGTISQKYDSKMKKYKHTFKKNENGSYYWYSTEPIEE